MSYLLECFSVRRCRTLIGLSVMIGSVLSCVSCHKEDPDGYRLSVTEFITSADREIQFQKAIIVELKKDPSAVKDPSVLSHRETTANKYLQELAIFAGNYKILLSDSLDDSRSQQLKQIARSGSRLIELATLSDQEMIGLHIRASSNTGVKDASLRSWAGSQTAVFMGNLNSLQ